jgi:hypothetical protein
LGDPAFAHCPHADRIFIVEEVVAVYEEQPPDSVTHPLKLPDDYATWPRYHDTHFGYSLPYPLNWTIEPLNDSDVLSAIVLRAPQWPDYPVRVRIHAGETHLDQYDPASTPPLLQHGMGQFEQGLFGAQNPDSQHLTGYLTWPEAAAGRSSIAVLFNGSGQTYELELTYPLGFDAPQPLLAIYSAIVEGFRLGVLPGPSPTPPVKQSLGAGPFLSRDQALVRAREQLGSEIELLDAQLMSEAEARRLSDCGIEGHPDGVWLFIVRGFFEGSTRTLRQFLDATTGENLCGEEIAPSATPLPTLPPDLTPTPVSTPSPGVTATPARPTPAPTATPMRSGADRYEPNFRFDNAALIALNTKYTHLNFAPWPASGPSPNASSTGGN